ncbi:LysR family transcriptional regulator [Marinomonas mediterranea]|jgi:Transcriptional regulator|uniref:Transcriptional regulator, LysR family n=1 Tax=Marinomonas mediterranea (strain ATCC 700492 / JCM 21426 / NBRC 103028 / MMB-1) TaxID=717774 RepID=F2K305_MARM1|nr:LysR family transcriptional regulator [Marinomonas mediterranea]ADZ92394.1 transcriptional regulator, LysR family [Marinomonas mediterranea MMB-1]WCN10346.1 LysR family transcriptional regulator [Marinomonas mediterranea]WCN14392.1 LysR family transcriptional regulator [Marinomonas mediterranea]WCN18444.1 LysR family transcriptional regulator [Marinomonas mediterranea MMB-1]
MNDKYIDWNDLKLFLAVAREGGLSAAARSTQRSPATLGRRMHQLERVMERELFHRHDRGYELTTDGKALLEEFTQIEAQILRQTAPLSTALRPLVKISAGTWTTHLLIKRLDMLTTPQSNTLIRFVAEEKILSISHREAVIGFRNQRPTEDFLVCRKLSRVEFAPYATKNAPDLWIKVIANTPSAGWLNRSIGNNIVCEVNNPRSSLDLAIEGNGIALLPTFIGDMHPQLLRVGKTIEELSHDQWLVTHHEDRYLPEVRSLIQRISTLFECY